MSRKEEIIKLFYEEHKKPTEIAKELKVVCSYVTKVIQKDERYIEEKEHRKEESKEKHKICKRQYAKKKREEENVCLAKGTKITMSDGSIKNIEDIKLGESVLTFNHELGIYEKQEVYFIWKGEQSENAFTLHFDNGKNISIVGKHDLFEKESLKYVTISYEDAEVFIGKHFYNIEDKKYVKLKSVTKETKEVDYYSIYTKYNKNCIADGMLTVPDDEDEFLNIYEFKEDLTINHEQLDLDIEKYGIFEHDTKWNYTQEEYNFMNLRYLNIAIGKELTTWKELVNTSEEYIENK